MAGFAEINFEDSGLKGFLLKLQVKLKTANKSKEFGGLISKTVFADIMDHFDKEQGPDGAWKPWSRSYMQAIAGLIAFRYINGKIVPITNDGQFKVPRSPGKKLQVTGRLRNSFKPNNYKATPEGIIFFNKAQTKDGFPYAAAHDEGGPKLPQRSFMWLSKKAMDDLTQITLKWLAEG